MLKAREMSHIRISGPKSRQKDVVNRLYELDLLHLINFKKEEQGFLDIGIPFPEGDTYSSELVKLRGLISYLKISGKGNFNINLGQASRKLLDVYANFEDNAKRLDELKKERESLTNSLGNPLLKLETRYDLLEGYKSVEVFKGTVKAPIKEELARRGLRDCHIIEKNAGSEYAIALFVPRKKANDILPLLKEFNFKERRLDFNIDQNQLVRKLQQANEEINKVENGFKKLSAENAEFLLGYEKKLSELSEKAEIPLRFGASKNAFVASGWVPTDSFEELQKAIAKSANNLTYVEEIKHAEGHNHEEEEQAPVALNNPGIVKPYEFLLDLYSLPKYMEVDPTVLMAFTFPLFFGFMLGDIGYGIVTTVLFFLLKRFFKSKDMQAILNILLIASISSIFFGFVFGEFFGLEIFEHPLINRAHDIPTMMMITMIVGLIHLNVGFIIGFYNVLKHHGLVKAVQEKLSWLILELGIAFIGLQMLGLFEFGTIIGAILALAAVLMLYLAEGPKGIIELPSLLSNTLSYLRLFGIGLSSVILAVIINKFANIFMAMGGFYIIGAILVLLVGHGLNIFLGVLGSFIQSVRLHYVEFFTKFFEGGGMPYSPFGKKGL
ncbi:MAG: V-type ATP synthase subunit I [archaeon]